MQRRALSSFVEGQPKRIIVGTSGMNAKGWTSTDRNVIDLLREDTWLQFFEPDEVDAILAEHVWEHLTPASATLAAQVCHKFLKPGGYLRVAVPDGLHPESSYIGWVKPGGTGAGADDHQVLYTYRSLQDVFRSVGFDTRLYEYFDEDGKFHFADWNPSDGMIHRSKRFDKRNAGGRLVYTSLILDAIKK